MNEPYRTQFAEMIRGGAASRDIHDASAERGYARTDGAADDAFVERELGRVAMHQRSLVPLLERHVGRADHVLDFGCGTGGTTVALAQSGLGAVETVGVDANPGVVAAARVRAAGHDLAPPRLAFSHVEPGQPLPFDDGRFDLVVTVSVLEFITRPDDRAAIVAELRRVVAPGGYLYVATPRPALREYHGKRLLGDVVRADGHPWSSPPWQVAAWGRGWRRIDVTAHLAAQVERRLPWLPAGLVARTLGPVLPLVGRWQKALWRRPAP